MKNIIKHIEENLHCSNIRAAMSGNTRFRLFANEQGYVLVTEYLSDGEVVGGDVFIEAAHGSISTDAIIAALDERLGS